MDRWCCFTSDLRDRLGDETLHHHALIWRGALLRNWSVWAWRLIWAELVSPLARQPGTREETVESFMAALPNATVGQAVVDGLHERPGREGRGRLLEQTRSPFLDFAAGDSVTWTITFGAIGAATAHAATRCRTTHHSE